MTVTRREFHDVTERAIGLALVGYSASDATVLATMGKAFTPDAIARVESLVVAVLARKLRRSA